MKPNFERQKAVAQNLMFIGLGMFLGNGLAAMACTEAGVLQPGTPLNTAFGAIIAITAVFVGVGGSIGMNAVERQEQAELASVPAG